MALALVRVKDLTLNRQLPHSGNGKSEYSKYILFGSGENETRSAELCNKADLNS